MSVKCDGSIGKPGVIYERVSDNCVGEFECQGCDACRQPEPSGKEQFSTSRCKKSSHGDHTWGTTDPTGYYAKCSCCGAVKAGSEVSWLAPQPAAIHPAAPIEDGELLALEQAWHETNPVWIVLPGKEGDEWGIGEPSPSEACLAMMMWEQDAQFTVLAHNSMPKLIALLRSSRAEMEGLRKLLRDAQKNLGHTSGCTFLAGGPEGKLCSCSFDPTVSDRINDALGGTPAQTGGKL